MTDRTHLTEDEARRLWRRAAELQAQAAARLEERSVVLADRSEAERGEGGYELSHVTGAAVEAGIGQEFVEQALGELELTQADLPKGSGLQRAFVGRLPHYLLASRTYDVPVARVYEALQEILPQPPFGLTLEDVVGGHPVEGGEMVFEVPSVLSAEATGAFAYDLYAWADVKEVRIRLRAVDEGSCQVLVAADMGRAKRLNVWIGAPIVAGVALAAGVGGVGLGALVLGPAVGLAGGTGAAVGSWLLGTRGWRALTRYGVGRGQKALGRLLTAVGAHIGSHGRYVPGTGAFPPLPGPPPSGETGPR